MTKIVNLAIALFASISAFAPALSHAYPTKTVFLVVPFSAGGSSDIMARALAQKLSELWKQPVIVENKPGATTTIAAEFVAKSADDGHTLLLASPAFVISHYVYPNLKYDPARDFAPVSLVAFYPLVLTVNPANPAKTLAELIAQAKAKPGMTYGSVGNGSMAHLTGELIRIRANANMIHVPYKGIQVVTDLIGGHIAFYFGGVTEVISHIRSGKLKALAVSGLAGKRQMLLPAVPTTQESGFPEIEASLWSTAIAPAGTSRKIIDLISADIAKVVAMPDFREKFTAQGAELVGSTPEEATQFIRSQNEKWGPLVKGLKISAN